MTTVTANWVRIPGQIGFDSLESGGHFLLQAQQLGANAYATKNVSTEALSDIVTLIDSAVMEFAPVTETITADTWLAAVYAHIYMMDALKLKATATLIMSAPIGAEPTVEAAASYQSMLNEAKQHGQTSGILLKQIIDAKGYPDQFHHSIMHLLMEICSEVEKLRQRIEKGG